MMSIYGVPSGANPIAAWIPSLDTVGRNTTTLTDLVGINHGELIGMDDDSNGDTSEKWQVSEGKYTLYFDGSGEHVVIPYDVSLSFGASEFAISAWLKCSQTSSRIWLGKDVASARDFACWINLAENGSTADGTVTLYDFNGYAGFGAESNVFSKTTWNHVVHTRRFDGATTYGDTYLNGTLIRTKVITKKTYALTNDIWLGGREYSGFFSGFTGYLDDIRWFVGSAVDAADVSYLYDYGNGRGRTLSTSRRRRVSQQSIGAI